MSNSVSATHTYVNSNGNQGNNTVTKKKRNKKSVLPNQTSTNSNVNQATKKKRNRRRKNKSEMSAIAQEPNPSENIFDYCKNLTVKDVEDPGMIWVDKIIEFYPSFNEQLLFVTAAVAADELFYEDARRLCNSLESILKDNLPGTDLSAVPFGSVATYLALKSSDVDVYLNFGNSKKPGNLLNLIRDIIAEHKKVLCFYNILAINAKVPIVKCLSAKAISCDISFSKSFGIYKSELIEFLISLDDRIRPIILVLKFWLKTRNLLDGNKISSFALVVLVIFFFQQCQNPLLPSVYQLRKYLPYKKMIDGWNVSFEKEKRLKPKTENNLSIFDFLKEFFRFYGELDYKTYVISPFVGKLLPISVFCNSKTIPQEFNGFASPKFKFITSSAAMYLQDPLVHDYNVTRTLEPKFCLEFSVKCSEAFKICELEEKKRMNKTYKSKFFKELFKHEKSSAHKISSNLSVVEIFKKNSSDPLSKLKWAEGIHKTLFEILTKVLKCRVGVSSTPDKIFKTVEKSQPNVFTCKMDFDFVDEELRKRAGGFVNGKIPFLQRQEKMSDYLLEKVFKESEGKGAKFQIVSFVKGDPVRLRLNFVNLETGKGKKQKFVSKVLNWLGKNLPSWVEKGMKG